MGAIRPTQNVWKSKGMKEKARTVTQKEKKKRMWNIVILPILVITPHSLIIGRKQLHGSPFWRLRLLIVSIA